MSAGMKGERCGSCGNGLEDGQTGKCGDCIEIEGGEAGDTAGTYDCERTRIVKQVAGLTTIAESEQDAARRLDRHIELSGEIVWTTVEEVAGYDTLVSQKAILAKAVQDAIAYLDWIVMPDNSAGKKVVELRAALSAAGAA